MPFAVTKIMATTLGEQHGGHDLGAVTPLEQTALDRYGRRSMAYRHEKTGRIVTYTEITERTLDVPEDRVGQNIMLRSFRRTNNMMCWSLFENVKPGLLRTALQYLSIPFMLLHVGYNQVRFMWETWRAGR